MAIMTRKNPDVALTRHDPFDPFRMMTEMLERSPMEAWFQQARTALPQGVLAPAFDVKERDDAYVIEADLPGMTEKDVDVTLSNNRLTISGKREAKHERNDERMHSIERQYGAFTRSFTLPNEADTDHIQGELHEGVLSLVVPKAEKSKSTKISLGHRIKKALKS